MAIDGVEVKRDLEAAAGWLKHAVIRGYPLAQVNLASLYLDGRGVERDEAYGVLLFQEAAFSGFPEAMTAMGLLVHQGADGAGLSTADWFEKAARAGDAQGQFLYAVALKEGDGRERNPSEARTWLDRALAQEDQLPADMIEGAKLLRSELVPDGR